MIGIPPQIKAIGILIIAGGLVIGTWLVRGYYEDSQELGVLKSDIETALADDKAHKEAIAELDAKYTQELNDAQAEIDRLTDDLAAGRKRLRLNAVCEDRTTAGPGEPDAAAPRLNDSAERDYLRLRERISTATAQILGLQEFIRTQCAGS